MKPNRPPLFLLSLWALAFAHTVKAATLAEFMGGYDWQSLKWAAGLALLGGTLRTIFSLQSDTRVVQHIAKEALWDALKALAAGMLAFVVLEAIRSTSWALSSEIRFTAVLVAGIFRMDSIYWMRDAGKEWAAVWKARFLAKPVDQSAETQPPKDTP